MPAHRRLHHGRAVVRLRQIGDDGDGGPARGGHLGGGRRELSRLEIGEGEPRARAREQQGGGAADARGGAGDDRDLARKGVRWR